MEINVYIRSSISQIIRNTIYDDICSFV